MKKIILTTLFSCVILFIFTPSSYAATRRSNSYWISSTKDGVTVVPYVKADKKALIVDFENFNGVEYVYYNLNYINKNTGILNGIEGSFIPSKEFYTGYLNGKPYIRKEFIFGTCSMGKCIYHKAKDVALTVNTKMKNGKHFSNIFKFPNDQF